MGLASFEAGFEQRLDQCWLSVLAADVLQQGNASGWKTISRDVRAGAVVMAIAEFEALLKNCLEETNRIIEASGSALKELQPGIRMLHYDSQFASTSGSSSGLDKAWGSRIALAEAHLSDTAPVLPRCDPKGNIQPLGSQTPRPATLARLWSVYGLPDQPVPNLRWRQSLGSLADARNDVAHARLPLAQAFAGKAMTADSVAESVHHVRDLGKHVVSSFDLYVSGGGFLV